MHGGRVRISWRNSAGLCTEVECLLELFAQERGQCPICQSFRAVGLIYERGLETSAWRCRSRSGSMHTKQGWLLCGTAVHRRPAPLSSRSGVAPKRNGPRSLCPLISDFVLIPMKLVTDSDLIPGAGSDVMPVTVGAKRRWRSYGA